MTDEELYAPQVDHDLVTDSYSDRIECPHCHAWIKDLWDYGSLGDDGSCIRVQCDSCGGAIQIRSSVIVRYEAKVLR